ncbi:hypothetical protein [Nocardia mexicana]|uniref:Uncharacterized protein n=1 Tax=Nocardia mexicana TaxID=279262 RepID=A0A370GRM5_9NOCA|nr:hypothetical protein [Nocardia mexicana]RDI46357.1 hypothetical protein DFR68_111115 [Nocardia mexicana]
MAIPVIDPADEATRQLSAAVHLDDELADVLVEEYLAEPKRATPPSPGVRAAAVLREAVGAQARRRIASAILLLLLLITAAVSLIFVVGWTVAGLAWRLSGLLTDRLSRSTYGQLVRLARPWQRWWVTAALWVLVDAVLSLIVAAPIVLLAYALGDSSTRAQFDEGELGETGSVGFPIGPILLAFIMFTVLVVYGLLRIRTAGAWFTYGVYDPKIPPRKFVAWACGPFAERLERIAADDSRRTQAAGSSEVVVYRGQNPFVGAGVRVQTWAIPLELHAGDGAAQEDSEPLFTPAELQDYISTDMQTLSANPTLSPGFRFSSLETVHWATLSAGHMVHYPAAAPLLEQLNSGRNPTLSVKDWVGLIDSSPEWLRYFRCYRLEAWERQLAVAGYLHVGCDHRTLYLEWIGHVLPPVAERFRTIDDRPRAQELRAFWKALCELTLLPITVPARIADLARWGRDLRGVGRRWRTPVEASRIFGSAASLRELAAGDSLTNFLEESDADRYLKIMERRVFDAVHRFLRSKGVGTDAFDSIVQQIDNSTVLNNCNVIAGNVGGAGNVGVVRAGTAAVQK